MCLSACGRVHEWSITGRETSRTVGCSSDTVYPVIRPTTEPRRLVSRKLRQRKRDAERTLTEEKRVVTSYWPVSHRKIALHRTSRTKALLANEPRIFFCSEINDLICKLTPCCRCSLTLDANNVQHVSGLVTRIILLRLDRMIG